MAICIEPTFNAEQTTTECKKKDTKFVKGNQLALPSSYFVTIYLNDLTSHMQALVTVDPLGSQCSSTVD